jgi:UDP-3-O-[3-hydroxymyristoyl] glucosamine N-acyltransferase
MAVESITFPPMKLEELAKATGAEIVGDGAVEVQSVNTLQDAQPGQVSFLANPKYIKQLQTTGASAVFVAPGISTDHTNLLRIKDPYYAFAQAAILLHGYRKHPHAGIHPRAFVDENSTIGEGTVVYPGAYIGPRCKIGRDCIIYANASIYDDTQIGDRVIVHSGAAVGVDGFGFATHNGVHHKIPQIGNVIVGDDVEIGANCAIERAAIGSTTIGKGTKIDGLVVVGHGTTIGEYGMIVAQVGIAGSVTLGHHVTLAGQVGVAGHIKIGDMVTVGAKAGIVNDVEDQMTLMGSPAMPIAHGRRVYTQFVKLPELHERVKKLEQQVEELSAGDDDGI